MAGSVFYFRYLLINGTGVSLKILSYANRIYPTPLFGNCVYQFGPGSQMATKGYFVIPTSNNRYGFCSRQTMFKKIDYYYSRQPNS